MIRIRQAQLTALVKRAGGMILKSYILAVWVGLCVLGYLIGTQARPDPKRIPYDDLFENMRVLSYREAPSDTTIHYVAELTARGKPFRQYDVGTRRFLPPTEAREYWRTVTGARYEPLEVRGHVERGVWLEIPDASQQSLVPEQFDELYSSTIGLVNPLSMIANAVGILSGYSVGYRLATWESSLSSRSVQERVLTAPGIDRLVAREAWRRVALEPAMVFADKDASRFAEVNGRQRLYANFFKVALNDTNGFVPYEVTRLESAGAYQASRAMSAFAEAARHAASDSSELTNTDFRAVEEWASLLDRRGHWAAGSLPSPGEERIRYLGALSWYGLAPESPNRRRLWVGPRLLIREGGAEGFVADELPQIAAACPEGWRTWMQPAGTPLASNSWTARWMGQARQFAPVLELGKRAVRLVSGEPKQRVVVARSAVAPPVPVVKSSMPIVADTRVVARVETTLPDSASLPHPGGADSVAVTLERLDADATVIRSSFGGFGR